jgi:hypothetical protein
MYKTTFVKRVIDADEPDELARYAVFKREEMLPFVPSSGQEFFWATERSQRLTTVTWNFIEKNFTCKVEDEFVNSVDIDSFDFDELVEQIPTWGWSLVGIYEAE